MRIATWNVAGLRARLPYVLHWLSARQPDVVGLQETKVPDDRFPFAEFERAGYRAAVHGQKGWNGVAVLARDEPRVVRKDLPGHEETGARLITVDVAGLTFTTLYLPNGKRLDHEDFPRKLAWMEDLHRLLAEHHEPGRAEVLCGDFNVCPAPLDSWNETMLAGTVHHTDDERSRFRALLDWGLLDLFRAKHPDEQKFSWWDYRGGAFHREMGLRIDFLLGSRSVATRLRDVFIDRDYRKKKEGLIASDHAPVVADLEWEA